MAREKSGKEKEPRRKKGGWFLKTVAVLFALGLFLIAGAFAVSDGVVAQSRDNILTPEQAAELGADCILVLGAGVYNGRPSPLLGDRINRGIELFELGAGKKLLMSGDHGRENYDEVNVMKQTAMAAGIASEDIFMDHAGFSTYESMYRAKEIFQVETIVIVTQEYHLYRALYIAERLGLTAYGVAARENNYSGQLYRDAREVLARDKDFLFCLFKPKPTYLGDAVPISGSGDLTNDYEKTEYGRQ